MASCACAVLTPQYVVHELRSYPRASPKIRTLILRHRNSQPEPQNVIGSTFKMFYIPTRPTPPPWWFGPGAVAETRQTDFINCTCQQMQKMICTLNKDPTKNSNCRCPPQLRSAGSPTKKSLNWALIHQRYATGAIFGSTSSLRLAMLLAI